MTRWLMLGAMAGLGGCILAPCDRSMDIPVTLLLEDGAGAAIEGATVEFGVDGGELGDCDELGDGRYTCGSDELGVYDIHVFATYYGTDVLEVEVGEGRCGLEGELVELEMPPLVCTDEEVAAFEVEVVDEDGLPIADAEVGWGWPLADMEPEPCDAFGGVWACAPERYGDLEVIVEAEGFEPYLGSTYVAHDGCHPLTEHVLAVMKAE